MVEVAKAAGVDALKLQIITARHAFARDSPSFPIFEKVELRREDWAPVVERARTLGLLVFSTFASPADLGAVEVFGEAGAGQQRQERMIPGRRMRPQARHSDGSGLSKTQEAAVD